MSAFDIQVLVGGINVTLQQESEDGPIHVAELGLLTVLPIGPGQAIPLGQIRAPLTAEAVDDAIEQLTEARKHMSKKSDIAIAGSLAGVDQVAAQQAQLRG